MIAFINGRLHIKNHIRGRGSEESPTGRFERFQTNDEIAFDDDEPAPLRTEVFKDTTKSILSTNDSPDIGMDTTINPYRGCEHGCIYCYARPSHEYLGLSAGLDFESKIYFKDNAAHLLRKKIESKNWQPRVITFSGITDCYQPLEKDLKITRSCLEVLQEFRNPFAIITKNNLVTRDLDIFKDMNADQAVSVSISITTLDRTLSRRMEPRASTPALRLKAVETLAAAGIPVNVMVAPIVPGLTDHEIPSILKAVADAGADSAHYTVMRLPYGVKDLFQTWITRHYPNKQEKVLNRIKSMRNGKLNDAEFGTRMTGQGIFADQIEQTFRLYKNKYHLTRRKTLSTASFKRKSPVQQDLFQLIT